MSTEIPSQEIPTIDGNGTSGLSYANFLGWLATFMDKPADLSLCCGMFAYAAAWMLAHSQSGGFHMDPKDSDVLRTPFGRLGLHLDKGMDKQTIHAKQDCTHVVAIITNLSAINP